ncbi:MAG: hypothetical protein ACRCX8_09740 [Sarcina sp.]
MKDMINKNTIKNITGVYLLFDKNVNHIVYTYDEVDLDTNKTIKMGEQDKVSIPSVSYAKRTNVAIQEGALEAEAILELVEKHL